MTNQEAIEIIKTAIAEVEWEFPMDYATAFDIAIECIQECIDKEDSPCFDCVRENCKGCLYNGRIG